MSHAEFGISIPPFVVLRIRLVEGEEAALAVIGGKVIVVLLNFALTVVRVVRGIWKIMLGEACRIRLTHPRETRDVDITRTFDNVPI